MFKYIKNKKRKKIIYEMRKLIKEINSYKKEILDKNTGVDKYYDDKGFERGIETMVLLKKIDDLEIKLSEYYYKLNKLK